MKLVLTALLSLILLSACVQVPGPGTGGNASPEGQAGPAGPAGNARVTPRPAATQEDAPARQNSESGSAAADAVSPTPGPLVPKVSTGISAASTVDLRTLQTSTPEPLPATGADVTVGQSAYGQKVQLKAGQTLAVILPGLNWQAPVYDTRLLKLLPWPGAVPAGMQAWLFQALSAGSGAFSVQTQQAPCTPGGHCSERPTMLFEITVEVSQ